MMIQYGGPSLYRVTILLEDILFILSVNSVSQLTMKTVIKHYDRVDE